jgi:hypothetical protein
MKHEIPKIKEEDGEDRRLIADEMPIVTEKNHLQFSLANKPFCGAKALSSLGSPLIHKGPCCSKCLNAFWKKFRGFRHEGIEVFLQENVTLKRTYVFCDEKPYVKRTQFAKLKEGSVFYFETPIGELEIVNDWRNDSGEFLLVAVDNPKVHSVDKNFKATNWGITCMTISEFQKKFETAIKLI